MNAKSGLEKYIILLGFIFNKRTKYYELKIYGINIFLKRFNCPYTYNEDIFVSGCCNKLMKVTYIHNLNELESYINHQIHRIIYHKDSIQDSSCELFTLFDDKTNEPINLKN